MKLKNVWRRTIHDKLASLFHSDFCIPIFRKNNLGIHAGIRQKVALLPSFPEFIDKSYT